MNAKILFFALALLMAISQAQGTAGSDSSGDSPDGWRKYYVELSFGNTVLFLDQTINGNTTDSKRETLPVPSFLFFSQWRASEYLSAAAIWNLPYGTVKRVRGTAVSERFVAPSYGAGITATIHTFTVLNKTFIEPEIALLVLRTYKSTSEKGDFFFPAGVFRLNMSRVSGLNLYAGVSQAPAKHTTAFLYGIGQRF